MPQSFCKDWNGCGFEVHPLSLFPLCNFIAFPPGHGAFIYSVQPFTVTLTGTLAVATPVSLAPGECCLLSAQSLPLDSFPSLLAGDFQSVMGFPATDCHELQKHLPGMPAFPLGPPNYAVYTHAAGAWLPSTPSVDPGESVLICHLNDCPLVPPPMLSCSLALGTLWPPNNTMRIPGFTFAATSTLSVTTHVTVYSDEPNPGWGVDAALNSNNLVLRARRIASGNGRVYLVVVTATETNGNSSFCCQTVVVPMNNSTGALTQVLGQALAAENACTSTGSLLTRS